VYRYAIPSGGVRITETDPHVDSNEQQFESQLRCCKADNESYCGKCRSGKVGSSTPRGLSSEDLVQMHSLSSRGSISSYNIAGLISEVSEEVATQIAKYCRRRQPHSYLRPPQEEPPRVSAYTLYFQKLEPSAYIFVAGCIVWVSIHSILCSGLQRRIFSALECVLAAQGCSASPKWYQSKARMRLPISQSLWLWSYLCTVSEIRRLIG